MQRQITTARVRGRFEFAVSKDLNLLNSTLLACLVWGSYSVLCLSFWKCHARAIGLSHLLPRIDSMFGQGNRDAALSEGTKTKDMS